LDRHLKIRDQRFVVPLPIGPEDATEEENLSEEWITVGFVVGLFDREERGSVCTRGTTNGLPR
jgi:hypothetical protein